MIIVRLMGGLGNQLFQYAIGKSMALKYQTSLYLDLGYYKHDDTRTYELSPFKISARIAPKHRIQRLKEPATGLRRLTPWSKHPVWVKERTFDFDPEVLSAGPNTYLDGYWQSPKYFSDIEKVLRGEIVLARSAEEPRRHMLENDFQARTSVCVHVRRGDYVNSRNISQVHGTCDQSYYDSATALILQEFRDARFYVFSDEPKWVMENMMLPLNSIVVSCGESASDDLMLMAQCKHFIIANSSFSWWAAWLSVCPVKRVIAPKKWANDVRLNTQFRFPESWRAI